MGGQDETDPHRGGVRYSSGGAPERRKIDGEPAGRPGPCTHPSKKSPAPIIPAGVRILTRRAAHRTLADLLRRLNPAIRGWCAYPPARGPPGARSATSTTSPSGEYSAGAPERHPRLNKHTVNRRFLPGWRIRDDGIEFFRACRVPVTRYRYRGTRIPSPRGGERARHDNGWRAGRAPMRTSGSQGRPAQTHPRKRGQGAAGRPYTYVRTMSGWVYVAFVTDVYSRRVIGRRTSTSLYTDLAAGALEMAVWARRREGADLTPARVHHSDRGAGYRAIRYGQTLAQCEAVASVGSRGDSFRLRSGRGPQLPVQGRAHPQPSPPR